MKRITLTTKQARDIQQSPAPWPADWAFALMEAAEKLDAIADDHRMSVALEMKKRGCSDVQIEQHVGWRSKTNAIKQINTWVVIQATIDKDG